MPGDQQDETGVLYEWRDHEGDAGELQREEGSDLHVLNVFDSDTGEGHGVYVDAEHAEGLCVALLNVLPPEARERVFQSETVLGMRDGRGKVGHSAEGVRDDFSACSMVFRGVTYGCEAGMDDDGFLHYRFTADPAPGRGQDRVRYEWTGRPAQRTSGSGDAPNPSTGSEAV